jgi:hypothetical protein
MFEVSARQLKSLVEPAEERRTRVEVLRHDYSASDLIESAFVVGRLMLYRSPSYEQPHVLPNINDTAYERWIEANLASRPYHANILTNWVTIFRNDFGQYPIFLYNRDYGQARRVLEQVLTQESPPAPYLYLIFLNAFRQAMGLSHDQVAALPLRGRRFAETAQVFNELLSGSAMDEWLQRKRQPIRFYGGATNTVLGLYDSVFADPATGLEFFNRGAQVRYDLGGGFNTSEIERLMECSFISADIVSPRCEDYDPDICFQIEDADGRRGIAGSTERERFLDRQRRVEYLPFNVMNDSFPDGAESYAIVSTGFLTSTVRPKEKRGEWRAEAGAGVGHLGLSIHAIARVVELVQKGKSVDLFTIQRASSRIYKYKTVLLQWRKGRLLRLITTNDELRPERWGEPALASIRAKIDPENESFRELLPRSARARV